MPEGVGYSRVMIRGRQVGILNEEGRSKVIWLDSKSDALVASLQSMLPIARHRGLHGWMPDVGTRLKYE